jgi:hypothetical protein
MTSRKKPCEYFMGKAYEPYAMVYFKLFESELLYC